MNPASILPLLLLLAWLLPLVSFICIVLAGKWMGKGGYYAAYIATGAIVTGCVLSQVALFGVWLPHHRLTASNHASHAAENEHHGTHAKADEHHTEHGSADAHGDAHGHHAGPVYYSGEWYPLASFGSLRISIGYYIDALTVAMFAMVTLIASCIHFYAIGYMHDELHAITDHEVRLSDGRHLHRPGRFYRFFQYLSLFCFSMLGLVIAGNIAMVFVFWELVGICSYFLIGFYIERKSASTAANKAFIVNRVGDFGMIIGLMALFGALGTFSFADEEGKEGVRPGIFSLVRPAELNGKDNHHQLIVPDGMVLSAAGPMVGNIVRDHAGDVAASQSEIAARVPEWRKSGLGYWLLVIAGLGIFCGCVGKSAQFPLHVWLPDAMEGPTPVSALVHSATMVAAGVYLVGRFFPVFTPEVLLVIAYVGCITLFMAATIALVATDIKRVLAYSTVSQLGYMMLSLGLGGWLAGMFHLFTHAFFKSLLFLCSGSVIHAVHTNDMTQMGGLLKKMPYTAWTMLIGCSAIIGAGIPLVFGLSGYYSKDAILEQALRFSQVNPAHGALFFFAAGGAALTAFYMFRMWYLTFLGTPRDQERHDHAHESPPVMVYPLLVLAVLAAGSGWRPSFGLVVGGVVIAIYLVTRIMGIGRGESGHTASHGHDHHHDHHHGHHADEHHAADHGSSMPLSALPVLLLFLAATAAGWFLLGDGHLGELLEQARPAGTAADSHGFLLADLVIPDEHQIHTPALYHSVVVPASLIAFATAMAGLAAATLIYWWRVIDATEIRQTFPRIYRFLVNKWWFDELYQIVFVRPVMFLARRISQLDRQLIDGLINGLAATVKRYSRLQDLIMDRGLVDGTINLAAYRTWDLGVALRSIQTGRLRQYVMFIVVGTVGLVVLFSFLGSGGPPKP